jgi:dsRNA-specific ribonuclease
MKFYRRVFKPDEVSDADEDVKMLADTFRSFVAGIYADQRNTAEQVIHDWLSKVIEPQMEEFAKFGLPLNKRAQRTLRELVEEETGRVPRYFLMKGSKKGPDVEVACLIRRWEFVDGSWKVTRGDSWKTLGRGCGQKMDVANSRAAMEALRKLQVSMLE